MIGRDVVTARREHFILRYNDLKDRVTWKSTYRRSSNLVRTEK